jgi:hypothetical protein
MTEQVFLLKRFFDASITANLSETAMMPKSRSKPTNRASLEGRSTETDKEKHND